MFLRFFQLCWRGTGVQPNAWATYSKESTPLVFELPVKPDLRRIGALSKTHAIAVLRALSWLVSAWEYRGLHLSRA